MASEDSGKKDNPSVDSDNTTKIINAKDNTMLIDLEKARQTDAVLIIIRGTPQGKRYSLNAEALTIGRDKAADLQLMDANVSRVHAKIFRDKDGLSLQDMGSRNGTFLNDVPIGTEVKPLRKEDMIRMGSTVLKYIPAGELETLYHLNITNAAFLDKLTGVYNRNYINDVLEAEFKRARSLHTEFALVIFDIDNFKKINDTYGHDGGDHVLKDMMQAILTNARLRERDFVGRFGGEEFLILLPGSNCQQAKEVAERVRKAVESHEFVYGDKKFNVTISMGAAEARADQMEANDLYKIADKALYQSKHEGKNRVTTADEIKKA